MMPQTEITFSYNLVTRSKNSKIKKANGSLGNYGYGYNIFLFLKQTMKDYLVHLSHGSMHEVLFWQFLFTNHTIKQRLSWKLKSMMSEIIISIIRYGPCVHIQAFSLFGLCWLSKSLSFSNSIYKFIFKTCFLIYNR